MASQPAHLLWTGRSDCTRSGSESLGQVALLASMVVSRLEAVLDYIKATDQEHLVYLIAQTKASKEHLLVSALSERS